MVELARERGVGAQVGDVQQLPFEDESFDCAVAAWMLYHVPDVERGLAELARVLKPGGRLVAVTNRSDHLRELRELLGGVSPSQFNARERRARSCSDISRTSSERDAGGSVNDSGSRRGRGLRRSSRALWARDLPEDFDGPLSVRRAPVIFVATK